MTDCTTKPLLFASDNRRQIVADFQAGDLTSDGGLPLLREVDPKIGLIDAINAAICDPAPPLAKPPACLPAGRLASGACGHRAIQVPCFRLRKHVRAEVLGPGACSHTWWPVHAVVEAPGRAGGCCGPGLFLCRWSSPLRGDGL